MPSSTFEGIVRAFIDDPLAFVPKYYTRLESIRKQYQESHLSTIGEKVIVSTIEREQNRCEAFVRARLVELWADEYPLESLREVMWREVTSGVGDWDKDEEEFWQSVPAEMGGADVDAETKPRWRKQSFPTASKEPLPKSRKCSPSTPPKDSSSAPPEALPKSPQDSRISPVLSDSETFDPQARPIRHQDISRQPQQNFLHSVRNDWFVRCMLRIRLIFLRFAVRGIFALSLIYLVLFCFMSLVEGIPLVGPVIGLLLRISSNKFFEWISSYRPQVWSTSSFDPYHIPSTIYSFFCSMFVPSPNSITDLGPVHIPLDTAFSSAYRSTMNLSAIALQMLSCAKLLNYSQTSLLKAAAIVKASDVYGRNELAIMYRLLNEATHNLTTILTAYDSGVNSQIRTLEMHFNMTNRRLTEIINEITYFTPSPIFTLISSLSVVSSASCVSLPFFFPLTPVASTGCILSFIISLQGSCYLHAFKAQDTGFLNKDSPICTPLSWFNIGRLSEAERATLQRQGDAIASEFLETISIAEYDLMNLFQLSENGINSANEVEELYAAINRRRYEGENRVKNEIGVLQVKAAYIPGWFDMLTGAKSSKGLSEQDKYHNVSLTTRLRNFDELAAAHKDAHGYFKSSELLLTIMSNAFNDLMNAVMDFRVHVDSPQDWARIKAEGERLQPLIEELKELGNYHSEQRRVVVSEWKERWVLCRMTRHDWEDCLYE